MLDALLIAGLVTAIATPVLVLIAECAKRITIAVTRSWPPPTHLTLPEASPVSVEPQSVLADNQADTGAGRDPDTIGNDIGNDLDDGIMHEVPGDVSEIVISDFRPGTDCCRIWLRSPDIKLDHWTSAVGAVVAFHDAAEQLTVTFQGLNYPPFEDIETVTDCPDKRRQVTSLTAPVDFDGANGTTEGVIDAEWRLAAWAETERAVEALDDPARFAAAEEYGRKLPEFTGFDANAECIEVWVSSTTDADAMVEVLSTHDGHHRLVMVAGRPTALLQGAPSASAHNIRLVPKTSKAA